MGAIGFTAKLDVRAECDHIEGKLPQGSSASYAISVAFSLRDVGIFHRHGLGGVGRWPPSTFPTKIRVAFSSNAAQSSSGTAYAASVGKPPRSSSTRTPVAFSLDATEIYHCGGIGGFCRKPPTPSPKRIPFALFKTRPKSSLGA